MFLSSMKYVYFPQLSSQFFTDIYWALKNHKMPYHIYGKLEYVCSIILLSVVSLPQQASLYTHASKLVHMHYHWQIYEDFDIA